MKLGIWCLIVASLTARASQPMQSAQPEVPPLAAQQQMMISTCDLSVRPDLQVLNGRFPLRLDQIQQPGLSLLSTERGPTADEQAALALYDQLHRSCVQAQANWCRDACYPEAGALQQEMFVSEQNHLAALYQGRETFAQFTRAVNALHVGFMNDKQRIAASKRDQYWQDIRSRSSAPVQTDCQTNHDGSWSCTTQQ